MAARGETYGLTSERETVLDPFTGFVYCFFSFPLCSQIPFPLPHLHLSFSDGRGTLEVAVTGTVVPVNLRVEPGTALDFGECPAGSTNTQQIQVGSA